MGRVCWGLQLRACCVLKRAKVTEATPLDAVRMVQEGGLPSSAVSSWGALWGLTCSVRDDGRDARVLLNGSPIQKEELWRTLALIDDVTVLRGKALLTFVSFVHVL